VAAREDRPPPERRARLAPEWPFEALKGHQPPDCDALWQLDEAIDGISRLPRPPGWNEVPAEARSAFSMGGRARVLSSTRWYFDETEASTAHRWSRAEVESLVFRTAQAVREGHFLVDGVRGSYSAEQRRPALVALFSEAAVGGRFLRGARALVIGSERPWLEAALLAAGAARVTTIEYNPRVVFEHPRLEVISWAEARRRREGSNPDPRGDRFRDWAPFDVVASFSSVEHSGLGRYGDRVAPRADLVAIGRAWCAARPGARMLLSVPTSMEGRDAVYWNAHRLYGRIRWPMLAAGWRLRWRMGSTVHGGVPGAPAGGFVVPWGKTNEEGYLEVPHVFARLPKGGQPRGGSKQPPPRAEAPRPRTASFLAPVPL
jgi:hypothetical protein